MTAQNDTFSLLKKVEEELKLREDQLRAVNVEVYKKNLELLSEKRRLEAILYNMGDAVLVLNGAEVLTLVNHTAQQLLALKEAEVLAKKADEVLSLWEESGGRVNFTHLRGLNFKADHLAAKKDFILKTRAGERTVKVHLTEVKLPGNLDPEFILLLTDITIEREVARMKDEFIGIVSHELRTPMTAIKGNLWMLQAGKGGPLPQKAREYLQRSVRGTERMIALINDILNATSLEQGRIDLKIEKINLKDLVLEELEELKVKATEKGLTLEVGDFTKVPLVLADKRRVLEVLVNFVGNAIKFTNKGYVVVSAQPIGDQVKVAVADSGKGFAPADREKLFSKFGRLDRSYVTVAEAGGTGLGLYISKMLVEKMAGTVGADSAGPNQGSTFWFTLPSAG